MKKINQVLLQGSLRAGKAFRSFISNLNWAWEGFTVRRKKWWLLCFCAIYSAGCLLRVVLAFVHGNGQPVFLPPPSLTFPVGKRNHQPVPKADTALYRRVEALKNHLDSMAFHDPAGYRRLQQTMPHLPDSIALFEKMYLSTIKK